MGAWVSPGSCSICPIGALLHASTSPAWHTPAAWGITYAEKGEASGKHGEECLAPTEVAGLRPPSPWSWTRQAKHGAAGAEAGMCRPWPWTNAEVRLSAGGVAALGVTTLCSTSGRQHAFSSFTIRSPPCRQRGPRFVAAWKPGGGISTVPLARSNWMSVGGIDSVHHRLVWSYQELGRAVPDSWLPRPRWVARQRKRGRWAVVRAGVAQREEEEARSWDRFLPLLRTTYPKIVPFVLPQRALIFRAWVCTSIAVWALFLLVPQVGELSTLLAQGDLRRLAKRAAWALVLVGVRSVAQYWQQTLLWESALNVAYLARRHVFGKVLGREMGYFEGLGGVPGGDIAFRITAEADDAADTVYALLLLVVPSGFQLVAMSARMVMLSPLLTFATVSVIPCMSLAIAKLGEKLRALSRKGQDSTAGLSAYLNEVLPSMFVVKAHAAEAFEESRFEKLAMADRTAHLNKKKMKALIPEVITAVYAATTLVLFAVGTWVISCGRFDGKGMVSFVTSMVLLVEPIQAMGKAYNDIKQGEPSIERLFDLASGSTQVMEEEDAVVLKKVAGNIRFSSVTFGYNDRSPRAMTNVSFTVAAGETIALVGPSGGGKTTLAKLLLRLYDPLQGHIEIDGHDIRDVTLKSLRRQVAIVPQETTLFTGTVAENIAYGDHLDDIDMKRVEEAAALANADEFIEKLPEGYLTNLGDRASSLSGGQRQRLAIARAVFQDSSILILDEATSALDNHSEKLVREALQRLMEHRTVLVIAHRLETVQKADRILFLDGGRLIEEGSHCSLLASGGRYASLYTRQERKPLIPPQTLAGH